MPVSILINQSPKVGTPVLRKIFMPMFLIGLITPYMLFRKISKRSCWVGLGWLVPRLLLST